MTEKKFNVTRDDKGKVVGIEFNAEAFIVPNHAGKLKDFWSKSTSEQVKEIATNVLGNKPVEDETYVQMWYVAKDIGCDNLVDHGANVEIDGEKHIIGLRSCYLPYTLLRDKIEGDTVDVTFTNYARGLDDEPGYGIPITMHVTLNQKDYRYRRFGEFQEVLRGVIS